MQAGTMKPKRAEQIETRLLPDGHVVLFSVRTNWAHTLTPIGAMTWELCDGETTTDEIKEQVANLIGRTESEPELRKQIEDLLGELSDLDLITEA